MPVYVLAGEEDLLIEERLEELKAEYVDPAWESFNFLRVDEPELKDVFDAAAAVPFGPGNKVIVMDRCGLFAKKRGKSQETDEEESSAKSARKSTDKSDDKSKLTLTQVLESVHPNTYLIFVCHANFDKTLKTSKSFQAVKGIHIEEFARYKYTNYDSKDNARILTWCQKRAHKFNMVIDDNASMYLAESTDANLREMSSEIEKASIYLMPEKRITLSVVSRLMPHHSNVFALLDHWMMGRKAEALRTLEELTGRNQPVLPIISLVQNNLSKWITIKTAADTILSGLHSDGGAQRRQLPNDEMARKIAAKTGMNEWILKSELERLRTAKLDWLMEKKQQLTELEASSKFGGIDQQQVLPIFFTT